MGVHEQLAQVSDEAKRLREAVRVLDEQVAYLDDVATEHAVEAAVAQTPLTRRRGLQAADDLARGRRERDRLADRLDRLTRMQDDLLERLQAQRA